MTDLDELERLALGGGNRAPNAILRLVAVARAAETLAAFAKTAPGRLPQPIQDAIELADSCRAAASLERMAPPVVGGGV